MPGDQPIVVIEAGPRAVDPRGAAAAGRGASVAGADDGGVPGAEDVTADARSRGPVVAPAAPPRSTAGPSPRLGPCP